MNKGVSLLSLLKLASLPSQLINDQLQMLLSLGACNIFIHIFINFFHDKCETKQIRVVK